MNPSMFRRSLCLLLLSIRASSAASTDLTREARDGRRLAIVEIVEPVQEEEALRFGLELAAEGVLHAAGDRRDQCLEALARAVPLGHRDERLEPRRLRDDVPRSRAFRVVARGRGAQEERLRRGPRAHRTDSTMPAGSSHSGPRRERRGAGLSVTRRALRARPGGGLQARARTRGGRPRHLRRDGRHRPRPRAAGAAPGEPRPPAEPTRTPHAGRGQETERPSRTAAARSVRCTTSRRVIPRRDPGRRHRRFWGSLERHVVCL